MPRPAPRRRTALVLSVPLLAVLGACGSMNTAMPATNPVDNASLPEAVRVPATARFRSTSTGVGEITYECREKKDAAGSYEWTFVAPVAVLYGPGQKVVGKYYAGPTWEASDGSKVSGKQVAVAPAAPGSIALQLVKADPATGAGAMQGVRYIQRLKTQGGVPPQAACGAGNLGARQQVAYRADYVFYGE